MNIQDLLHKHAAQLAEHFDSVQILAEITENECTKGFKAGRGSVFARQGMAHEFINEEKADLIGRSVAYHTKPPEEDFSI